MRFITRFLTKSVFWLAGFTVAVGLAAVLAVGLYALTLMPNLPEISDVDEIELKVPLRIYTSDNQLIAEYGDERRQPVDIAEVPDALKKAVLAAEDARFASHIGVDFLGVARAALANFRSGAPGQGASTITMQVARNFFLTREKTYDRKLKEVLLSFRLERVLSKDQILELYFNKIFLGHRAYGFAAAAKVYYDSDLADLTTAQMAMLAGLPKAPSTTNPLSNPKRAKTRRNYVLARMNENGWLPDAEHDAARNTPVSADLHVTKVDVKSPYVAEEIRKCVVEHFSDTAYSSGLRVYTTIDPRLQDAAVAAVRDGIVNYETRHGWRGPAGSIDLNNYQHREELNLRLNEEESSRDLRPAVVLAVGDQNAQMLMAGDRDNPGGVEIEVPWDGIKWARRYETAERIGPEINNAGDALTTGMLVYVQPDAEQSGWRLSQLPEVSAALVSMNPESGAIQAMAGGFDFYVSKFNRATQAERQPGSNIKPFIYSAAIDTADVTPATVISGAPLTISNSDIEMPWRPENYSGKFVGPTRLRKALANSLNLVSVRLLKHIGTSYTRDYLEKFGFDREKLPNGLPLALGATSITPVELAGAYAVFANGGYRIQPHLIARVEDSKGNPIEWNKFITAPRAVKSASDTKANGSEKDAVELDKNQTVVTFADSETDASDTSTPVAEPVSPLCMAVQVKVCRDCSDEENPQSLEDLNAAPKAFVDAQSGNTYTAAKRILAPDTAFLMRSLMGQVVQSGTARKAKDQLNRNDLAGKTGTTNDFNDAWFSGYNSKITTTVWVGYDQPASLGRGESGARAALPIWIDYMRTALDGVAEELPTAPSSIVQRPVDKESGQVVAADTPNSMVEYFKASNAPPAVGQTVSRTDAGTPALDPSVTDTNSGTRPVNSNRPVEAVTVPNRTIDGGPANDPEFPGTANEQTQDTAADGAEQDENLF